jgi:hypothetical protein
VVGRAFVVFAGDFANRTWCVLAGNLGAEVGDVFVLRTVYVFVVLAEAFQFFGDRDRAPWGWEVAKEVFEVDG